MADFSVLNAEIRAAIKNNNAQEITGNVLQAVLLDMVDDLGKGVTSGEINGEALDLKLYGEINLTSGYEKYISYPGAVITDNSVFRLFIFSAKGGQLVTLHSTTDTDVTAIATSTDGSTWTPVVRGHGADGFWDSIYTVQSDCFVAVSYRKVDGTTLKVSESVSENISVSKFESPVGNILGNISGYIGTGGSIVSSEYHRTVIIPVTKGQMISFYCYADTDQLTIAFSKNQTTWSKLSQGCENTTPYGYIGRAYDDGYIGLSYRVVSGFSPTLTVGYMSDLDYETAYDYAEPEIHGKEALYTNPGLCAVQYSRSDRIRIVGVYAAPGSQITLRFSGVANLSLNNGAYLYKRNVVSSMSGAAISNGEISLTMPNDANEAMFAIKKSGGGNFSAAEIAALTVTVVRGETEGIPAADAKEAFMVAMNQKAAHIGMSASTFNNPYGGDVGGYNESTVLDLLKMAILACGFPKLCDVWSTQSETCQIYGANQRSVTITAGTQALLDTYYSEMHTGQTNPYYLLGSKGGGWSYGEHKAFSFIGVTEIGGKLVVAVSATTQGDGTTGRVARMKGLIELFDIASVYIAGGSISGMSVTQVEKAIVAILPLYPECRKTQTPDIIYSLNPEVAFNPASCSKVLAMVTMLDIIGNFEETHDIRSAELINDSSNYTAQAGDVESINTSLYAMMLGSNAANTLALARVCGEKILISRNKFL